MKAIGKIGIISLLLIIYGCDDEIITNSGISKKMEQQVKSDLQEMGLRGKVKVLKQEEFLKGKSESEIGVKTGENSYSYKFNNEGYKCEEQYYDNEGLISKYSQYEFDTPIRKKCKKIKDLDNNLLKEFKYEYNEFGLIEKIAITDFNGFDKYEYFSHLEYDIYGNETHSTLMTTAGAKISSADYTFKNNQKTELVIQDNMESPYAKCLYEYNQHGDVNKEIYYTGNNLLYAEYSSEYVYDSKNNWIKKTYSLDKKHMNSSANSELQLGVQTITMRTITYY
jgi:hypothetical protein